MLPAAPCPRPEPAAVDALEDHLRALVDVAAADAEAPRGRGRPPLLPAAALWSALTVGILRGDLSQVAIWRRLVDRHWWFHGQLQLSREAVYHRLDRPGPSPMRTFFTQITARLLERRAAAPGCAELAPFAAEVVALDESTLAMAARKCPELRATPPGAKALLAGKLTAVFDLRRQLYRSVALQASGTQNEKVAARTAVADLPPGSLIVADLGYFSFAWFDDLTEAGHFWLSRCRQGTSVVEIAVLAEQAGARDTLVWLGAHRADRARHPARLLTFTHAGKTYRYLTNVTDPARLSLAEAARLYARRWDIEMAFNLVKTDLHLTLLWSAKPSVLQHQVWGVLLIAQLILAARAEVAERAAATVDEVSLALLARHLPAYGLVAADPIGEFARDGRRLGFIRPSRRVRIAAPEFPPGAVAPPPTPLPTRPPRYAGKA